MTIPLSLPLEAISENWRITFMAMKAKGVSLIERPFFEIVLLGQTHAKKMCRSLLIDWLRNKASIVLPLQLKLLSEEIQLPFRQVSVRDQKTLWGSCTAHGNISLNYKLLFLPTAVMRYVLIHELCHTKELNHSPRFWALVEKYDANYKINRKLLRELEKNMPNWL